MRVMTIGTEREAPKVKFIAGNLEDLQQLVGGYIQAAAPVELRDHGIQMLVDEEGLLKGLDVNRNLIPFFYVGKAVFVGVRGEDFVSLTEIQMEYLKCWLRSLED